MTIFEPIGDFLREQGQEALVTAFHTYFPGFTEIAPQIMMWAFGITIYAVLIWNFYRNLAKRDIFDVGKKVEARYGKGRKAGALTGFLKYILFFPLYSFIWFIGLSFFLFLLTENIPLDTILFISISVVSGTRILAYYQEDLARDLAKMLPFALLAIFLTDPSFLSVGILLSRIMVMIGVVPTAGKFVLFVVLLEMVLRLLFGGVKEEEAAKRRMEERRLARESELLAKEEILEQMTGMKTLPKGKITGQEREPQYGK